MPAFASASLLGFLASVGDSPVMLCFVVLYSARTKGIRSGHWYFIGSASFCFPFITFFVFISLERRSGHNVLDSLLFEFGFDP